MAAKSRPPEKTPRWNSGAEIAMRVIRKFAREASERFQPDKIILFG